LRNYGYHVIDLGKDVAAETIIATAKKQNSDVIALSALMTTTMVNMKRCDNAGAGKGNSKSHFMIGGAVVYPTLTQSLSARLSPKTAWKPLE